MKIVALSQRVDCWPERGEQRDAVDQRLVEWLAYAGYLAVPVPNSLPEPALSTWLDKIHPEAALLSGGNDIGEYPTRDRTESRLIEYAEAHRLPLLGICRGMQMLATAAGGKLKPVSGHTRTRHALVGQAGIEVNSFHNFALAAPPTGYTITASTEDGTIEGIRHNDLPWEGWMWHPERESEFSPRDIERVKALFS